VRVLAKTTELLFPIVIGRAIANNKRVRDKSFLVSFISILFFGICFGVLPFVFNLRLNEAFELPKVILYIFTIYFVIGLLVAILPSLTDYFKITLLDVLLGIMIVWAGISNLANGLGIESWVGASLRYQGWLYFLSLGVFVIVCKIALTKIKLSQLARIVLASNIGLTGLIWGSFVVRLWGGEVWELGGFLAGLSGNPNFAGGILALSYMFGFLAIGATNLWLLVPVFGAMVLTGSRGAMLALALMLMAYVIYRSKLKWQKVVLTVLIVVATAGFYPQKEISKYDRREVIWERASSAIWQKPIVGWGLENFDKAFEANLEDYDFDLKNVRVDKAHNILLNYLVELGVVGGGLFLAISFLTIKELWKKREKEEVLVVLIVLFGYLLIAMVNISNINENLFYWLAVAVASQYMSKFRLKPVRLETKKQT